MILNRTTFHACFTNTNGRVKYLFGAKPEWDADSSTFDVSDCSGFTRWMLSRSVSGLQSFPEGSVQQHEWCGGQLQMVTISEAAQNYTNEIYQFFLAPADSSDGVGHTGFFQNGMSFECYGSHGVGSRPAQHLLNIGVKYAYLWPSQV